MRIWFTGVNSGVTWKYITITISLTTEYALNTNLLQTVGNEIHEYSDQYHYVFMLLQDPWTEQYEHILLQCSLSFTL
jgi:hypothetical protein